MIITKDGVVKVFLHVHLEAVRRWELGVSASRSDPPGSLEDFVDQVLGELDTVTARMARWYPDEATSTEGEGNDGG